MWKSKRAYVPVNLLPKFRRGTKVKLLGLPKFVGSQGWEECVANMYTALTGKLCLIVEKNGECCALVTEIPVGVPPVVVETAEKAAGIIDDKYKLNERRLAEIMAYTQLNTDEYFGCNRSDRLPVGYRLVRSRAKNRFSKIFVHKSKLV